MDSLETRKSAIDGAMKNDYYDQLKNESYRAMLDSEIQANVAKDQALKYVNNGLNANGFGNQGMAESSKVGIMNVYNKALGDAQATHSKNMIDINANQNEDYYRSMTTLMNNAGDANSLNQTLKDYNIDIGEDNRLGGEGFNSLDANSQKEIQALYDQYMSQFNSTGYGVDTNAQPGFSSMNEFSTLTTMNGTNALANGTGVANEINYILNNDNFLSTLSNGKAVCLMNKSNSASKLYLQFINGKWYQISEEQYWNAPSKELVKGK